MVGSFNGILWDVLGVAILVVLLGLGVEFFILNRLEIKKKKQQ